MQILETIQILRFYSFWKAWSMLSNRVFEPLEYHFNVLISQKEVKQKLEKASKHELVESNRVRKLKSGLGLSVLKIWCQTI